MDRDNLQRRQKPPAPAAAPAAVRLHNGMLYLLKYAPSYGIWMHIDNVLRSGANVFTIGVGRDVTHDVVQVIPEASDADAKMPMLR